MDVGFEPGADGAEFAGGNELVEREFDFELAGELGGVEVAQGVGRKVAEVAVGPMDVLQYAVGVGGRFDA